MPTVRDYTQTELSAYLERRESTNSLVDHYGRSTVFRSWREAHNLDDPLRELVHVTVKPPERTWLQQDTALVKKITEISEAAGAGQAFKLTDLYLETQIDEDLVIKRGALAFRVDYAAPLLPIVGAATGIPLPKGVKVTKGMLSTLDKVLTAYSVPKDIKVQARDDFAKIVSAAIQQTKWHAEGEYTVVLSRSLSSFLGLGMHKVDSGSCFSSTGVYASHKLKLAAHEGSFVLLIYNGKHELPEGSKGVKRQVWGRCWGIVQGERVLLSNMYASNTEIAWRVAEEAVRVLFPFVAQKLSAVGESLAYVDEADLYCNGDDRTWTSDGGFRIHLDLTSQFDLRQCEWCEATINSDNYVVYDEITLRSGCTDCANWDDFEEHYRVGEDMRWCADCNQRGAEVRYRTEDAVLDLQLCEACADDRICDAADLADQQRQLELDGGNNASA